ncbi:MAG: type II toxin-antitoxin system PemK/MazF family toxin [bacterium]
MKRGEIWWVRFRPPVGRRPAVLVSRNQAYQVRNAVTVVPLTRTTRAIHAEVPLGPADGVPRPSVANADDILTVPKTWVEQYLTTLPSAKMESLEQAIKFALDLP